MALFGIGRGVDESMLLKHCTISTKAVFLRMPHHWGRCATLQMSTVWNAALLLPRTAFDAIPIPQHPAVPTLRSMKCSIHMTASNRLRHYLRSHIVSKYGSAQNRIYTAEQTTMPGFGSLLAQRRAKGQLDGAHLPRSYRTRSAASASPHTAIHCPSASCQYHGHSVTVCVCSR